MGDILNFDYTWHSGAAYIRNIKDRLPNDVKTPTEMQVRYVRRWDETFQKGGYSANI